MRGGFTAIELILSLSLASVVTASTVLATQRALGAYRSAQSTTHLDRDLRTAMDRIRWELMASGESVLFPTDFEDEYGTDDLTFQQVVSIQDGQATWGPTQRLVFEDEGGEPFDGVDNDGDGLVDEGVLAHYRNVGQANELRVVLVTGVTRFAEGELENDLDDDGNGRTDEAGFNLQRSGDVISVLLCLGRARSGGEPVTRTMTASVRLRN